MNVDRNANRYEKGRPEHSWKNSFWPGHFSGKSRTTLHTHDRHWAADEKSLSNHKRGSWEDSQSLQNLKPCPTQPPSISQQHRKGPFHRIRWSAIFPHLNHWRNNHIVLAFRVATGTLTGICDVSRQGICLPPRTPWANPPRTKVENSPHEPYRQDHYHTVLLPATSSCPMP